MRSLRNLDLAAPSGEQIVALVDADPNVEKQLAQQLAVPPQVEVNEEDAGSALMDAALMSGATEAMLDNYNETLKKESNMLRKEVDNLANPVKVKRLPLKALLAAQDAAIRRREAEREAGSLDDGRVYIPRQIMGSDHTYCSEKRVSELTPIDMEELRAPQRYDGRYMLVQVASRLTMYASCAFVGIMPSGGAIPVSIAHFSPKLALHSAELDALLPIGTTLLIREPYVSQHYFGVGGPITGGKGMVGVRVDTPSDVHVLDDDAPELEGVVWSQAPAPVPRRRVLWRQEGPLVRALQKKATPPALTRDDVHSDVHELLKQERPGAAWREVCAAQKLGVLSRSVVSDALLEADLLMALGEFEKVRDCLEQCSAFDAGVTERRNTADRALHIGRVGPSDAELHAMFQATLHDATPRFNFAQYVGPVAVELIPGAGRGLVLTRDVAEGELLLFCRAMASTYAMDTACRGMPLLRCNPESGVTSTTTQVLAATRCIHTILDRPELAVPFLGLTAGPDTPNSKYVNEPYPLQVRVDDAGGEVPFVSAQYVDNVLRFNAFGPAAVPAAEAGNDPMSRSTMPHPLPAILNHACLPNVSSVFFGDFVTTRALHPLRKGTQIMHQYVQGEVPYDTRQAQLSKHGFVCACGLCELDAADGVERRKQREHMLARDWPPLLDRSRALFKGQHDAEAAHDAHRDMAESMQTLAHALDSTYAPTRPALRPDMVDVWFRTAMHVRQYDVAAAMLLAQKSLGATGATLADSGRRRVSHLPDLHFDGGIRSMLMLADMHWHAGAHAEAFAWLASAVDTHTSMIGGGLALFLQRWGGESAVGAYEAPLQAWISATS